MNKLVKVNNTGFLSAYSCYGPIALMRMDTDTIMKGILAGYDIVELVNSTEVKLDFKNYDKDNCHKEVAKVEVKEIPTQKVVNSGTDNRRIARNRKKHYNQDKKKIDYKEV